jgi:hypothetical protein
MEKTTNQTPFEPHGFQIGYDEQQMIRVKTHGKLGFASALHLSLVMLKSLKENIVANLPGDAPAPAVEKEIYDMINMAVSSFLSDSTIFPHMNEFNPQDIAGNLTAIAMENLLRDKPDLAPKDLKVEDIMAEEDRLIKEKFEALKEENPADFQRIQDEIKARRAAFQKAHAAGFKKPCGCPANKVCNCYVDDRGEAMPEPANREQRRAKQFNKPQTQRKVVRK